LKKKTREAFIVEDCAQAFGSRIDDKPVGVFGDAGFYSFNRGKNLPTYEGGCIITDSDELQQALEDKISKLPSLAFSRRLALGIKFSAMALAFRPYFYGLFHPLIAHFKDNAVERYFDEARYTFFQAGICRSLLKRSEVFLKRRSENGFELMTSLEGIEGIVLPKISTRCRPIFNRMPVILKDRTLLETVACQLEKAGIETSRFYLKALHHIFDLGYEKEDFPNAVYLAERLLTLPVHPLVRQKDIEAMAKVIKEVVG